MAQIEIPSDWRQSVCAILKRGTKGREIVWTIDAGQDFEADFLDAWPYDAHDAFVRFLSGSSATGCLVPMDRPPGTTYEFYFILKGKKAYGKILLKTDRKSVVIFSAHLPRKAKLSCE
jgi:hypothetical protein